MSVTTPILRSECAAAEAEAPAEPDAAADSDAPADAPAEADPDAAADGAATEAAADAAVDGAAADGDAPPLLHAATKMDRPANRVSPRERVRMVPPLIRRPRVHGGLLPGDREGRLHRRRTTPTIVCIL